MIINIHANAVSFKLLKEFNISRNSKTHADTIHLTITDENGVKGISECVPYARYGESIEKTINELKHLNNIDINSFKDVYNKLVYKSSKNALDSAFVDYQCKLNNIRAWDYFNINKVNKILTSYTISLNTPTNMLQDCINNSNFEILKLKFSDENDVDRIAKIREKLPHKRIIIDVNEGWNEKNFKQLINELSQFNIEIIEQPLPSNIDDLLIDYKSPVKLCADESFHTENDLEICLNKYDAINIKLDKIGGVTNAVNCIQKANSMGLTTMIGCMVSSSLSMAQAFIPALLSDYCDLDGTLLLNDDIENKLTIDDKGFITPFSNKTWG